MAFEQVYIRYPDGQQHGPASIEDVKGWARARQIPDNCWLVDAQTGEGRPLAAFPEITKLIPAQGTEVFIPKNGKALVAYYAGLFSWIGVFFCGLPGLLVGGTAVVFGILALKAAKVNPLLRGQAHAWVGIISGGLAALLGLAFFSGFVIAILQDV